MKKLIFITILAVIATSCHTPGTTYNVDEGNHPKYNIERYYYDKEDYVIIVTRKDSQPVTNVSWKQSQGKTTVTRSAVIDDNTTSNTPKVFENDSIIYTYK